MVNSLTAFLYQVLIAIDQLVNALLLGYADETLSSRAYRAHSKGRFWGQVFMPVINTLFFSRNHCAEAYNSERLRLQVPPEAR